ncbi:MAG: PA2169 family four-helix-bundle protein [Caldilineales bacterium]
MNHQTINLLSRLAALCTVSAQGYSVAAESQRNRGLKMILHSYAIERASLSDELNEEIERLGGTSRRHRNPLAALHRGWINLKATMAIGAETSQSIVLDEVARGERTANKRFQAALQAEMPEETRRLVEHCAQRVQSAAQHIDQLRGATDQQLVVRLVDDRADMERATAELMAAGFSTDQIGAIPADDLIDKSGRTIRHTIVRETVATTALLVGLAGLLLGVLMAILSLTTQTFGPEAQSIKVATAVGWPLIGLFVGVLFGAIIGGMLGQGVSEQDSCSPPTRWPMATAS